MLILTPSSLVRNWQAEFTKWLGRERITVYLVDSGTKITEYIKQPLASGDDYFQFPFSDLINVFLFL